MPTPHVHRHALSLYIYKVSLRSLFILAILAATDLSMVRSAISTMSPPRISGLTLGTTLRVWPFWTYCEFLMAFSRREMVLLSRGCVMSVVVLTLFLNPPTVLFHPISESTYRSAGNGKLNLAAVCTHEHTELLYDTL